MSIDDEDEPGPDVTTEVPASALGLKDLGNSAGVVVTGFIAVLNYVGLKGGEVSNIFRSESPVVTTIVYLLLALSLLSAIISIAVPKSVWRLRSPECLAISILLAGIALLINVVTVPPPPPAASVSKSANDVGELLSSGHVAEAVTLVGFIAGVVAVIWRLLRGSTEKGVSTKTALVLIAICLALISSYSGVRIEARSQLKSSYPQVSAQLKPASNNSQPTFDVSASSSRMRYPSRVDLRVYGVRKDFDVLRQCGTVTATGEARSAAQCNIAPCNYFAFTNARRCDELVVAALQPDESGAVAPKTFTVEPDPAVYNQVEVFAQICTSLTYGDLCAPDQYAAGSAPKFGLANLVVPGS